MIILVSLSAQSRLYQPASEEEKQFYASINKNIWPDDVRKNIGEYTNTLVCWVGIIENVTVDFNNDEYYILGIYIKHYYYDWIEDFGIGNRPIKLSSDGEGYIFCNYYMKKNWEEDVIKIVAEDIIDNCAILYCLPLEILDGGIINVNVKYLRTIDEQYVEMNWKKYGRNW
jgi:hypothetical protein